MPPQKTLVLVLLLSVGCTLHNGTGKFWNAMRFRDDDHPGDSKGDPWVQSAGEFTRKEHTPEKVHDPLKLRNIFMSEQARSIERNLGVGD